MLKQSMHSVVYEIWPRSFKDSDGDGIGDIPGIIAKLDYLKDLGINLIWLCPIFVSPDFDYGYDIQDYYNIQPAFGSMADFDRLIKEAKDRGIGILLDLVANHTSDRHPWYQEALKDPKSPYRDYYYFKEGKNGKEPNNWISFFGGSAWSKIPNEDNLYILNSWAPEQKDLNWNNPKVREGVADIIRFWMRKGIAGFRMDVINIIAKKAGLPDYEPHKKGYQFAKDYIVSLPDSFVWIKELYHAVLKEFPGLYIGEGMLINTEHARQYSGLESEQLDLMFQFDLIGIDCGPLGRHDFRKLYRWNVKQFKKIIFGWMKASEEQNFMLGNCLSNHDQERTVSHFGDTGRYHAESAKLLNLFTLTLRGTPFLYQGEEIGMTSFNLEKDEWKDIEAINAYQVLQTMLHAPAFIAKKVVQKKSRDNARSPMQWEGDQKGGFTTGEPWMRLNPNTPLINVGDQLNDPDSILNFTKNVIKFHRDNPVLTFGSFIPVLEEHSQIVAYLRRDDTKMLVILLNLSKQPATFNAKHEWVEGVNLFCTYPNCGPMNLKMVFRPYEGRVIEVKSLDTEA